MKWMNFLVLLGALCLIGCTDTSGGDAGDQNDPAATGDDDAQMNEGNEDVDTTSNE